MIWGKKNKKRIEEWKWTWYSNEPWYHIKVKTFMDERKILLIISVQEINRGYIYTWGKEPCKQWHASRCLVIDVSPYNTYTSSDHMTLKTKKENRKITKKEGRERKQRNRTLKKKTVKVVVISFHDNRSAMISPSHLTATTDHRSWSHRHRRFTA